MIHTSDWLLYVSRIRGTGKKKSFQLEIIHTCFPELDTQYRISAAGGASIKTTSIADKKSTKMMFAYFIPHRFSPGTCGAGRPTKTHGYLK